MKFFAYVKINCWRLTRQSLFHKTLVRDLGFLKKNFCNLDKNLENFKCYLWSNKCSNINWRFVYCEYTAYQKVLKLSKAITIVLCGFVLDFDED